MSKCDIITAGGLQSIVKKTLQTEIKDLKENLSVFYQVELDWANMLVRISDYHTLKTYLPYH